MTPPPSSPRQAISAAAEALRAGQPEALTRALLEAWRATRAAELAELYELCVRRHRAAELEGPTPEARLDSFRQRARERAGDPALLPVLLAESAHAELPEIARLALLVPWTPDPLLARTLAHELLHPRVDRDQLGAEEVAAETLRLLVAQKDPRQLGVLEALAREPRLSSRLRRQLRDALTRLEAQGPRRLDAPARAKLAPIAARMDPQRARERRSAELLAAVFAQPAADGPRLVYADWLTELGDPRGAFITLQIERHGGGQPPTQAELALLERHLHAWSEPLHPVLGRAGRRFERGFLASASIESRLEPAQIDEPAWATLETLDGHVPEALLVRGQLGDLRTLYGFLALERFVLLRAAGRLGAVAHYECSLADPNLRFSSPLGLRSLLVRRALDEQLIALVESPAVAGLEELAVYFDVGHLGASSGWTGDHRERPFLRARYELLCDRLPAHVGRLTMIDGRTARASRPLGWRLRFERDASGALSQLRIEHRSARPGWAPRNDQGRAQMKLGLLDDLADLVDALPLERLARLILGRFDTPVVERSVLLERLARPGLDIVDADPG